MKSDAYAEFYISSPNKTPDEISEIVGIPCDKSKRIGDKRGKSIITEKENLCLISHLPETATLPSQVTNLLERVEPYSKKIKQLSEEATVQLSCVIHTDTDSAPILNFNETVIQSCIFWAEVWI